MGVAFALTAAATFGLALVLTQHEAGDLDGRVRTVSTMAIVAVMALATLVPSTHTINRSNTFNDSDIAIRTITESRQSSLVSGAIVRCHCLFHTVKFKQHGTLLQPKFIGHCRLTTCYEATACCCECGPCEIGRAHV